MNRVDRIKMNYGGLYMKLSNRLNDALVEQVRFEYEAAWLYNGMRIFLDDLGAVGATRWMTAQVHEELHHAQDFIDFIMEADGEISEVGGFDVARCDYDGLLSVREAGLAHEKQITKSITDILEIAIEEKNYPAENFLRTYVDEQLEEEDSFRSVIELIELAGDDKAAMFRVDSILGQRED